MLSRVTLLCSVSAKFRCASVAGPRLTGIAVTTTTKRISSFVIASSSPTFSERDGFARSPLTCTSPPATASVACERLLKKRQNHNHLSIRSDVAESSGADKAKSPNENGHRQHSATGARRSSLRDEDYFVEPKRYCSSAPHSRGFVRLTEREIPSVVTAATVPS
jgi:hypothetical protein